MIGVLLLNMGGPDSLEAVKPFLQNLFSDREIIKLGPPFLQKPIASFIIAKRLRGVKKAYSMIGGKSPLTQITTAQANALQESLNSSPIINQQSLPVKVYIGMRYWRPFIEDTVRQMHDDGIKNIVALSLYPHYSIATTGSSITALKKALIKVYKQDKSKCETMCDKSSCKIICQPVTAHCITSWFDHPLYISALVEQIEKGMSQFNEKPVVLFSAHSLPQKFIDEGDPYADEIKGTIAAVTKKIDIEWHLSYQSKTGPVKWLAPSTELMLQKLAGEGVRNLLIVPISFVSDHIETLYEIDILYVSMAKELGINMRRMESLNTSPKFIDALKDLVAGKTNDQGWL